MERCDVDPFFGKDLLFGRAQWCGGRGGNGTGPDLHRLKLPQRTGIGDEISAAIIADIGAQSGRQELAWDEIGAGFCEGFEAEIVHRFRCQSGADVGIPQLSRGVGGDQCAVTQRDGIAVQAGVIGGDCGGRESGCRR